MNQKKWMGLGLVALLLVGIGFWGFYPRRSAQLTKLDKLGDEFMSKLSEGIAESSKSTEEKAKELGIDADADLDDPQIQAKLREEEQKKWEEMGKQFGEEMSKLSKEEQEAYMAEKQDAWMGQMMGAIEKGMDDFFAKSPDEQLTEIDKSIDEMQKAFSDPEVQKQMQEAANGQGNAGAGPFGFMGMGGGQSFGDDSKGKVQQQTKMLDMTTPGLRAKLDRFTGMLTKRMAERGVTFPNMPGL